MKTDWLPVIINKSKAGAGVCSPLKTELLLIFFYDECDQSLQKH